MATRPKRGVLPPLTFVHFKEGELWCRTEDGFEFPVPVADVGTATMLAKDKALMFMRYIRKQVDMLNQARTAAGVVA